MDEYIGAVILGIVLYLGFEIFEKVLRSKMKNMAQKTKTDVDNLAVDILISIHSSFYVYVSFFAAIRLLTIHQTFSKILYGILILFLVYEAIGAMKILLDYVLRKRLDGRNDEHEKANDKALVGLVRQILVGVMWMFGILLILSNLGVDITSLIAGLGIGGIAVALALQNVLGDLFSAFSIYFDKPFEVGDFIVIGDVSGTVEKIGIKTTRIRSLQGEEVVVANNDLTSTRLHNYRKLERRRVVFGFGITYDTSQKHLREIPSYVEEVISQVEQTQFDRAHFNEFADSSLNFEVVYYVESQDYNLFMDVQQQILLMINEKFAKEKIEFAFPTQTVHLQK